MRSTEKNIPQINAPIALIFHVRFSFHRNEIECFQYKWKNILRNYQLDFFLKRCGWPEIKVLKELMIYL